MTQDLKTTVLGEPVKREKNTILYYSPDGKRVVRTITYATVESARAEYNRITGSSKGRPLGSIDIHSNRHRPCARVYYTQLIIRL